MKTRFYIANREFSVIAPIRLFLLLLGILIVVFNDTFGKIEGFMEFLLIYFILVIIALTQWLFVNIRFLINLKNEKQRQSF